MVETIEAMVGVLVAVNDRPLNVAERQAEFARVERFVKDPKELKKKIKQEQEDTDRVTQMMEAMPDALLYEYGGTETGKPESGESRDKPLRLNFHSNPKYNPPSRVEQVLTAMQGYVLIDADKNRFVRIEGTLARDVGFGWGILGHLDRGGHFLVEQCKVTEGHWRVARMHLDFTGKILFFKDLEIKSDEMYSDYRPVPSNLTFAQGFALLRSPSGEADCQNHHQPRIRSGHSGKGRVQAGRRSGRRCGRHQGLLSLRPGSACAART
jgi:hypothetical protein